MLENSIGKTSALSKTENSISAPQVRELSSDDIARKFQDKDIARRENQAEEIYAERTPPGKRDWL